MDLGHLSIQVSAPGVPLITRQMNALAKAVNSLRGKTIDIRVNRIGKELDKTSTGMASVAKETNKSVIAAGKYEKSIDSSTKALASRNKELRAEVKNAGAVTYAAGMRERPTKGVAPAYSKFTETLRTRYAGKLGIGKDDVKAIEKYTMSGKLMSTTLSTSAISGKKLTQSFKSFDPVLNSVEGKIDGIGSSLIKAKSSSSLLKGEFKDIGGTLKNVKVPKDAFTTKMIKDYSKQLRIDPRQIGFMEKFNMQGKLTETRLNAVNNSGKKVGETFTVLQKKSGRWVSPLGKLNDGLNNLRWTMVNVMFAAMAIGVIASPFVMATKGAMEYEVALKRISAVTGTTTTEIRSDILSIRRDTPFAINEVSDAYLAFTKAGFSAAEAAKAVPDILKLSIAGFIDLGEAGKITAQILHQFSLEASEASRVADVLANAANISAADVQDFGTAMAYVGPIAVSAGLELEEMAGALAILSNAGFRGSKMGTNLRQALSDIIEPSKEAETLMKEMGVSFFTTAGDMKDLDSIITTLRVALSGLSTEEEKLAALGDIFDIRGLSAINTFIKQAETGKATIAGYAEAVKEVGYANKLAAIQMEASTNQLKIFIENLKTDAVVMFGETINKYFGNILKGINETSEESKKIKALLDIGFIEPFDYKEFLKSDDVSRTDLMKGVGRLEQEYGKEGIELAIEFGISEDSYTNIAKDLKKWEKLIPELKIQGRLKLAKTYRTEIASVNFAMKDMLRKAAEDPENKSKYMDEYLGKVKESRTAIVRTEQAELNRLASVLSIVAAYDELTGKLKYSASELKMNEEQYKNISEKVKEIKEMSKLISIGKEAGKDVTGLKKLKSDLIQDFTKMDLSVNVTAMIKTELFDKALDVLSRSFKNLEETSRIEMLTGADKDVEKVKVKVEELAKKLRGYIRTVKEKKLDMEIVGVEESIAKMEAHVVTLESAAKRTVGLEAVEKSFVRQIRDLRDELELANKTLTNHRDKLSEVNKEISRLSGQRFTGETEFLKLIQEQNKYLDEQRLAELGIFDVQKFITDAIKRTSGGYDGLVKSMEKVNKIAEASKNTYDSWKSTVEEFIKASIKSGQDLGADVTGKVKKFQTMLLGVTDMPGVDSGTTEAEQNLERLKLAYDYYYGSMREDVKFATMEHEDSVNGIASGSGVVISALQTHWSEQIKLNSAINESSSYVKTLNERLSDETGYLRDVTDELTIQNGVIKDGTTFIWAQIAAWAELRKNMDAFGGEQKTNYPGTGMSIAPSSKPPNWLESDYYKSTFGYSEFAKGGIVNSPTRALIGEAGPEAIIPLDKINKLGGNNITVTVNVSTDANPEEIAREVKRELMSL